MSSVVTDTLLLNITLYWPNYPNIDPNIARREILIGKGTVQINHILYFTFPYRKYSLPFNRNKYTQ